jgi:hypothetical protein
MRMADSLCRLAATGCPMFLAMLIIAHSGYACQAILAPIRTYVRNFKVAARPHSDRNLDSCRRIGYYRVEQRQGLLPIA